jgi:hypothetical protein
MSDRTGCYYTMELLDGQDLRELAPLGLREACSHLRDVASSLGLLHVRRLIHRDVSPRNVRLTSEGRAKLIDFGALTTFGTPMEVVGTPACAAPKWCAGALARCFVAAAEQAPVVLLVDNLDQADEESLALLTGLAYEAREMRLLIVATRTPEAKPAAPAALRGVAAVAETVELHDLASAVVTALVYGIFGDVRTPGVQGWRGSATTHGARPRRSASAGVGCPSRRACP